MTMKIPLLAIAATFLLACVSMIAQAALPISSIQTSDFDSVITSPPFNDIDPPNDVIDDLSYEAWRYETVLAPSPGIISRNSPSDADISTTSIRIRTADSSRFSAISIDFFAADGAGASPPYNLALYGYSANGQVPGNVISRSNIPPGTSETLSLNWDNVDEIRVVVDSDFVVFDNLTVGPAITPDGCDNINGVISPVTTASINSFDPLSWQAGEIVSAQVIAPTGGATTAEFLLGGSVVASASIPGTVSYELPADIDANYEFRLDAGSATWEPSCAQPAETPAAVPVMPFWLLGFMAAAIAGIASLRIGRKQ